MKMADTILTGSSHCSYCVLSCGRQVKITDDPFAPVCGAGPEYQTLAMFGSNCLIDNLEAIAKANELCNRYGLDTISTAAAIAFAMEAYEKGIITKKDTGGIDLTWGNPVSMLETIHQIARGEHIGEFLGMGVKTASEILGEKISEFSIHSKGLAFPGHDPRAQYSSAVAYATSNRGACHLQAYAHDFELDGPEGPGMPELGFCAEDLERFSAVRKGEYVAKMQNLMCMFDSLLLCKFLIRGGITISRIIDWFNFVTGWDIDFTEFMHIGERLYNIKRLYNTRCGINRKDDTIPHRILNLAAAEGARKGRLPPLEIMLDEYYAFRGWNTSGIPLPETLKRLNIETDTIQGEDT
jgi:aldehyde:ferredoxin oxidoreductase